MCIKYYGERAHFVTHFFLIIFYIFGHNLNERHNAFFEFLFARVYFEFAFAGRGPGVTSKTANPLAGRNAPAGRIQNACRGL